MRVRGLVLFSGGLDSILAVRLLQDQAIEVEGVTFVTPFFGAQNAREAAERLGMSLHVLDITEDHLVLVKDPPHGYGKNMNPCLDCHALMIRKAGDLLRKEGMDFLFTGEVLNERPFSQNKRALEQVARLSGYGEILLRPLSAKLLPETVPETKGLVDRSRLLDISGRSRKRQFALAQKYQIVAYPSPAGGCLLTDPAFSRRLRESFEAGQSSARDMELLRLGRHFRSPEGQKIILGRHQLENEALRETLGPGDVFIHNHEFPGPDALLPEGASQKAIELACQLCVAYSDSPEDRSTSVLVEREGNVEEMTASPASKDTVETLLVR